MIRTLSVAVTALGMSGAALAQSPADLQKCRSLTDAAARLACYDAIPLGSAAVPPAVAAPRPAAPAAASAPTASPTAPAPQTPSQFGLEQKNEQAKLSAIESSVVGRVESWGPGTRFELANGQVWQVSDDSVGIANLNNPKARISRGAFGTFFLEMEGTNRSPRVKRIK